MRKKIVKRTSTEVITFPSRGQILQRDWRNSSTQDIDREIVRLRRMQGDAEEDAVRLQAELTAKRKVATAAKNDANALEGLIETTRR